jgi:monoamine oxidase
MNDDRNQDSRHGFLKKAAVAVPGMAAATVMGVTKSSWDKEADIVVIGTEFAGLSTTIAAKDAGAKVLILEKMPQKHEGGNNQPIPNLYSAGEMGSFWGWMYNGGGNNAEARSPAVSPPETSSGFSFTAFATESTEISERK